VFLVAPEELDGMEQWYRAYDEVTDEQALAMVSQLKGRPPPVRARRGPPPPVRVDTEPAAKPREA
ncbi:MAG: hypothetical protein R3185_08650, partial [Candidatus Thermoplasmatota archaeon]|nr:hypothetical protein [Candidatus Thermoplasmatota archaeon]